MTTTFFRWLDDVLYSLVCLDPVQRIYLLLCSVWPVLATVTSTETLNIMVLYLKILSKMMKKYENNCQTNQCDKY
jgi:hypothetical protein